MVSSSNIGNDRLATSFRATQTSTPTVVDMCRNISNLSYNTSDSESKDNMILILSDDKIEDSKGSIIVNINS